MKTFVLTDVLTKEQQRVGFILKAEDGALVDLYWRGKIVGVFFSTVTVQEIQQEAQKLMDAQELIEK